MKKLNKVYRYNIIDDFIGNVLIAWNKASQGEKDNSFNYLAKIPKRYRHLEKIQNGFLRCYFDTNDTHNFYQAIVQNEDYNFSRYNFFLTNYLLFKNKNLEAKKIIQNARQKHNSNILLKETEA